jgi:hypothetical protein
MSHTKEVSELAFLCVPGCCLLPTEGPVCRQDWGVLGQVWCYTAEYTASIQRECSSQCGCCIVWHAGVRVMFIGIAVLLKW